MKRFLFLVLAASVLSASTASAHYLWFRINPKIGDNGRADLYFEESPNSGDGKYTPPIFKRGKAWIRTLKQPKPSEIKLTAVKAPGKLWLGSELNIGGPRAVDAYVQWGVYPYGKTMVLLHYTARTVDAQTQEDFNKLGKSSVSDLDLATSVDGKTVSLQVFWKGKPVANAPIYLRGPVRGNQKADKNGKLSFEATKPGLYFMRTYVEEKDKSGEFEGKKYDLKRYHCSMSIQLPLSASAK